MLKWFGALRRNNRAMVFVDYEYCFYSYKGNHNITPSPISWLEFLEKSYTISDMMVFGDFSPSDINGELGKIRGVTNTIIETGNTFMRRKKDMTDFIMLDYIYQCADSRGDIDTYIIFTGDGHFQSVVKYLTQKKKKKVVICGVKETLSKQLKAVASEVVELPIEEEVFANYCRMIAANMAYIDDKSEIIPTFMRTVEVVSRYNGVPQKQIRETLHEMIERGYVRQEDRQIGKTTMKVLIPNWKKIKKAGMLEE